MDIVPAHLLENYIGSRKQSLFQLQASSAQLVNPPRLCGRMGPSQFALLISQGMDRLGKMRLSGPCACTLLSHVIRKSTKVVSMGRATFLHPRAVGVCQS